MDRSVPFQIRLSKKERQILKKLADERGVTCSALVRQLVRDAAKKLEREKDHA